MKTSFSLRTFIFLALFIHLNAHATWQKVNLPNLFMRPCEGKDCSHTNKKQGGVYSTQIPEAPTKWFPPEKDCPQKDAFGKNIYRRTSTRWRSDLLLKAKGISFKGLFYNSTLGSSKNEFSVFYHEDKCYNGSGEYGWIFRENEKQGHFYLCGNCNFKDKPPFKRPQQIWHTWPGNLKCVSGDCERVLAALKNPATYRYWNATLLNDGDFKIQFVDPSNWASLECVLKSPTNFPKWKNKGGYITVVAHKGAEEISKAAPFMHVDEVKVWR